MYCQIQFYIKSHSNSALHLRISKTVIFFEFWEDDGEIPVWRTRGGALSIFY